LNRIAGKAKTDTLLAVTPSSRIQYEEAKEAVD
jgi:hypothetical protein